MAGERGPFEIIEIPAAGAYGAVAVVRWHAQGGRVVAVKVSKLGHLNRPRLLGRARDEARLLFKLRHPNVVRVEELINVGGRPVLVMEWIEGVTVRALLEETGALPLPVALEIARRTALALDAAWNSESDGRPLRIVHRDIKPSNLLVSVAGEVKVVDFGIARAEFDDREVSTLSTVLGTHGYIAPERLEGVQDAPAIDVYALGVTLLELLVGRSPELPRTPDRHARALEQVVAVVGDLGGPVVGEALTALLGRMCGWDWSARPTAAEVSDALGHALLALGGPPDLQAFAADLVAPLHDARLLVPPREHPEWKNLDFLEEPWLVAERLPARDDAIPTTNAQADSEADRRLRRFLSHADWSSRIRELTWLLANNAGWTEAPFLDVLGAADTPWWRVWEKRATPAEVVASLQMLRYRRTARVLTWARALASHANAAIAKAAADLLKADD